MISSTSDNIFSIVIAFAFLLIALILVGVIIQNSLQRSRKIERRLEGVNGTQIRGVASGQQAGNILTQIGAHLTLPDADKISRIRFLLSQAGYYGANAVKSYLAIRLIILFVPQFINLAGWGLLNYSITPTNVIVIAAALAVAGLFGPDYFLRWKKSRRTDQCRKGFPDMMDLLVASIEAGLGLDAAFIRVGQEIGGRYPALKINLDIMNLELRSGRLRHEAMISFAERIDLEEAKALAVMLKQAEDMGSSIGRALRMFSEDMRSKRMLRAEEKAMALSAKLTVPLIVFIFPTIMVLILVPVGIRISVALT